MNFWIHRKEKFESEQEETRRITDLVQSVPVTAKEKVKFHKSDCLSVCLSVNPLGSSFP